MRKFELGKTYMTRSLCNYDCIITLKVIARTNATITAIDDCGETKKYRISKKLTEIRDAETVMPWGTYSMAPMISADKEMELVEG